MAHIRFKGLEEYERKLSQLERAYREQIAGKAIYAGSAIVADAIKRGIEGLPVVTGYGTQLVARGVESGTNWKQKKPFIRPAINASRKEAEKKMAEVIDEEIQKLME